MIHVHTKLLLHPSFLVNRLFSKEVAHRSMKIIFAPRYRPIPDLFQTYDSSSVSLDCFHSVLFIVYLIILLHLQYSPSKADLSSFICLLYSFTFFFSPQGQVYWIMTVGNKLSYTNDCSKANLLAKLAKR